jgi:hypothetical protein
VEVAIRAFTGGDIGRALNLWSGSIDGALRKKVSRNLDAAINKRPQTFITNLPR